MTRHFRLSARDWLMANVPRQRAPHDGKPARDYAQAWLARRHRDGWAGIGWPKEYGGRGLSSEKIILWYEEYVRARAPSVLDCTFVALNHAGPTLIACGTEAQKSLPPAANSVGRRDLVPGVLGARRGLRPRIAVDCGPVGRRRSCGERPEDLDELRGHRRFPGTADPDRSGIAAAQGPLLGHLRHAKPRDHGAPDREHGGRPAFRRGLLRRRAHSAARTSWAICTTAGASR